MMEFIIHCAQIDLLSSCYKQENWLQFMHFFLGKILFEIFTIHKKNYILQLCENFSILYHLLQRALTELSTQGIFN